MSKRWKVDRLTSAISSSPSRTDWVGEKFSRLKFMTTGGTRPELRSMQELEVIELGVRGKKALWLTLQQVADLDPRLDGTELKRLQERAEEQVARIEEHRLALARPALSGGPESGQG